MLRPERNSANKCGGTLGLLTSHMHERPSVPTCTRAQCYSLSPSFADDIVVPKCDAGEDTGPEDDSKAAN